MQMESWRERGFVPDSDDEDGFDSQEKKITLDARVDDDVSVEEPAGTAASGNDGKTSEERDDAREHELGSAEETGDAVDLEDTASSDGDEDVDLLPLPLPDERPQTPDNDERDEVDLGDIIAQTNCPRWELSTPGGQLAESSFIPAGDDPSSILRAKQQRASWDVPSSSPDLLQLDHQSPRRQTSPTSTPTPKAKPASQPHVQIENVEDSPLFSPLSSPLSSLHSSALGEIDDLPGPEQPPSQTLEALLSPLDTSEDVLRELDQPTRRSLRQRNPIQLHPYLLEDAKYQSLMRARGLKPVRVALQEQRAPPAADESHGEDLGTDTGSTSDSQMTGFQFPLSSPIYARRLSEITMQGDFVDGRNGQNLQQQKPPADRTGPRSPKRRRVIGPEDNHPNHKLRPIHRPQVMINNISSSRPSDVPSVFDIPSPPRSGTVSSPAQKSNGFRFPRGFSTPIITPRTETRKGTKDVFDTDSVLPEIGVEIDQASDDARFVRSGSRSRSTSEDEAEEVEEDAQEAFVRRYQRKIKGVLPASWLRLDQQKQKGIPSATQRNQERMARMETEAGKGVARKITKKADSSGPFNARAQLLSLRELAEESDQDIAERSADSDDSDDEETRQHLANLLGINDPFLDQVSDGDIPEDNRIDDMFPTTSRNHTSLHGRKQPKKRTRPDMDEARPHGHSKKPRLERQARLTDAIYGGRKKKQPSQSLPKLGILDAPDVTSRPRKEQPQFLRIAARKARSRQDRGRRSPSRKVIRLSSRLDTEDANASLREWRGGRMRQTALPRVSSLIPRRQPLRDLSTNARDVFNNLSAKRAEARGRTKAQPTTKPRNNTTARENVQTSDTTWDTASNGRDTATKPVQQRRDNAWNVRRNLAITSLSRSNPRPVAPEVASHHGTARAPSSLQTSLALMNHDGNLLLNRFLSGDPSPQKSPRATTEMEKPKPALPKPVVEPRRRQVKKRQPKRISLNAAEDHASLGFVSSAPEPQEHRSREQIPQTQINGRLNSFRTAYSVDYDVSPLQSGIFFHGSTFIGSGDFSRSLDIAKRDLDNCAGFSQFKLGDRSMRWGPWDDTVSSELGVAFDEILKTAEIGGTDGNLEKTCQEKNDSGGDIYRSLIKYASEVLSFVDPIDRAGFVTRANSLVSKLLEELSTMVSATGHDTDILLTIAARNAIFTNQICQIACHGLVDQSIQDEALNLAKSASRQVIGLVSKPTGLAGIQRFLAASKSQKWREVGIKNDHPVVEAYVIVQHVLRSTDRFKGCLDNFMADAFLVIDAKPQSEKDINALESGWQRVFTTLPLQEIDALGLSHVGSRFTGGYDNWTVVKRLLRPVLESGEANSKTQPISYYSYCRVLFKRCFVLINGWGWRSCKPILDALYDFFAERTLYNLRLEECYKSPSFLDELDGNPSFDVLPGDPCFHILLKIIASGLRFLSKTYDKKKIRNYTWRLLPNHGRNYPKEQSIHQADLGALRNHHDLLCTLYSSVPGGCRPRLETIKALVHPASSHLETCKISLRSWTRLARFKLSTNEDVSGLEPFADWHGYFVTEFLKQHSLARREVEAQNDGGKQFSEELIDRTVAQNQKQIESLLEMALRGLQGAIKTAPTLEHAQKIVSQTPIKPILDLFSTRITRLNATVLEGLQVISIYVQKCSSPSIACHTKENPTAPVDEDSQDYGDWTDIEAVYGNGVVPTPPGVEHVEQVFHPAVSRLVSNCFGEDRCPDDAILRSVVDCWTSIAHTLVRHGLRQWDNYLSPYEGDSWVALRWTTQTRKFTPQFLAKCIEKDAQFMTDCKMQILGMWLSSLVERVSMLKFQHRLTEALLNQDAQDPVLKNLPFVRDPREGQYSITFAELSQRRLSLISSLLSNMRAHIQDLDDTESRELTTTRQDYREILQKMMSSMKANYQELGNGEAEVQGAYVSFVHSVVGFLQQHTRDICPIDPFFTDPTSFPLPSTDPTYIVARLKGYEPNLSSAKVAKTLIVFVQNVSERAALDGQQTYLVNQLHDSMAETYESGNLDQPTLRATLLQCVFPAYLATVFDNPAAWILSRPVIETTTRVFKDLLLNMDATDPGCVQSILNIFSAIFESSYKALHRITNNTNMLKEPTVLITITTLLNMITSALPVVDYIDRLAAATATATIIDQIRAFQHLASFAISQLQDQPLDSPFALPISTSIPLPTDTNNTNSISLSAARDLRTYLTDRWSHHQGKYYFTRRGGHQPQEVVIEAPIAARLNQYSKRGVVDAAERFLALLDGFGLFGDGKNEEEEEEEEEDRYEFGLSEDVLVL
ncbi:hypothetical protein BDV12DRAFT_166647 [Aspergillus spectabilis]